MEPYKIKQNLKYGICLNSRDCKVFSTSHTTYEVKRGCLAKFKYRHYDQNPSVLTLVTNKKEVYSRKSLCYCFIDHKLFKYLNAINDFEERLKFFMDDERRKFVLHLEKSSSVVSVDFSGGKQTIALFHEPYARGEIIFITVELLEIPSSEIKKSLKIFSHKISTRHLEYSLPANLIRKPETVALNENYHEPRNNQTIDTSYNKASNNEPKSDFTCKTVEQNVKRNENLLVTRDVPTCLSTDIITNSRICGLCSNVREGIICLSCVNETKNMFGENNSQIKVDSNKSSDTRLSSEKTITPLEINTHVINEYHLPGNSKLAVRRNTSTSNCIICKKHLNISDGFVLMLCKHTFCEICIKKQISLEMLAHSNTMPCCDRPIEQDEIKYFLNNDEYEQFKAPYKQQRFDTNCSGYTWEKCGEEGPITFTCNKCELENCLKCETIHIPLTCEKYYKIRNSVDKKTAEVFVTWIRDGIAMPCPKCEVLITKEEGCDWVQCPFCNIEICWATRGPRWGPGGNGDTSGGCGCDFKVKKCIENCIYCH